MAGEIFMGVEWPGSGLSDGGHETRRLQLRRPAAAHGSATSMQVFSESLKSEGGLRRWVELKGDGGEFKLIGAERVGFARNARGHRGKFRHGLRRRWPDGGGKLVPQSG